MSSSSDGGESASFLNGKWTSENAHEFAMHCDTQLATVLLSCADLLKPRMVKPGEEMPSLDAKRVIGNKEYLQWVVVNGALSAAQVADWIKLEDTALAVRKANLAAERKCLVIFLKWMSPAMQQQFEIVPGAKAAMATHDLFQIFPLMLRAIALPGAAHSVQLLGSMSDLAQKGDFGAYCSLLRAFEKDFIESFQENVVRKLLGKCSKEKKKINKPHST
jgi:hypothetical protein